MRLLSAIAIASAAELGLAGACLGLLSLAGPWNGWLDIVAQFAPVWLVLSVAAAVVGWLVLEPGTDRRVLMATAAVGVLTNGVLVAPELARALPSPVGGAQTTNPVRILTFNVWEKNLDPGATADSILRSDADVVALQDVAGLGAAQHAALLNTYPFWLTCQPSPCDIAVLSKRPWTSSGFRILPAAGGLAVVWGETAAPDGRAVRIATTHYVWPIPPRPQADQRAALAAVVKGLATPDMILTGDFNLAPWSAALSAQDRELSPLVRRTRAVFTWPAIIPRANWAAPFPLLPIDHIYAGPAWRTVEITRLPRAGSDHYGVLATLERSQQTAH